jgi:hypothetical protein
MPISGMSNPTQFRHYLIAQDAEGNNIEVVRSGEQVGVLAFDSQRMSFVHCHVLLESLKNRKSFEDRGQIIRDRGHPLLARLVDFGEDDGSPFYITENVDGETLTSYLSRTESIPVWLAIKISVGALRAVEACLARGDFMPISPLDSLRIIQTGPMRLSILLADYRMLADASSKSGKGRLVKGAFEKQSQFISAFFSEQSSGKSAIDEPIINATDFSELLQKLISTAGPGLEAEITKLIKELTVGKPATPMGELAAHYKPRSLLAPHLATFQELARSSVHSVRVLSQKLDSTNPYTLRGNLLKSGQSIVLEQVPPYRMAGNLVNDALREVQNVPKTGKFPNLVPIVYMEEVEGIQCMAETAVEGVALSELLDSRGTLEVQESYLVLAGLDAALGQLEKAGVGTKKLRLEDIFLFTGFGREHPQETTLLETKLNEWPGFSIVLRTHPCLHSMACRGTDPGIHLPLSSKVKPDVEFIWNGGWMAALCSLLIGRPMSVGIAAATEDAQTDSAYRLLDDEMAKTRSGNPTARAAFLARYARVIQQYDLAQPTGGFWQELSGSSSAQGRAMEVARKASNLPASRGEIADTTKKRELGFAELLIGGHAPDDEPEVSTGGLRKMAPGVRSRQHSESVESSWRSLRSETPAWVQALFFVIGSITLGALLAQISGRSIWQKEPAPEIPIAEVIVAPRAEVVPPISLPVPPVKPLMDIDLDKPAKK